MTLTLTDATSNIRTDLADPAGSDERWSDAAIQRELDRAVARYSAVSPLLGATQLPSVPRSKIYPSPSGSWWVDRVEYPLGRWPK